tara:strand:+ start:912 stop:1814 length:903 start_codon:yes stop_codon:yes gene_type:complete
MSEIEEWSKRHGDSLLLGLPIQMAKASEAVYALCMLASQDKLLAEESNRPSHETWICFYRNHRRVRTVFFDSFFPALTAREEQVDVRDALKERVFQRLERKEATSIADLESLLDSEFSKCVESERGLSEILAIPEVLFFFRIALPCWYQYGRTPGQLFRNSLRGCKESILKLLNLDPRIQEEPKIRHTLFEMQRSETYKKKVSRAVTGSLYRPPSEAQVKILLAGLIDRYQQILTRTMPKSGLPIDVPKLGEQSLRDLFDAVAQDKGLEMEEDIPDSPEAFYKAIYRNRKTWPSSLNDLM